MEAVLEHIMRFVDVCFRYDMVHRKNYPNNPLRFSDVWPQNNTDDE
jgi:hypothetical protein